MKGLHFIVFEVLGFLAGILLWLASFVIDVPKLVGEPSIERVALDKKNIESMPAIEIENVLVIGK